MSDRNEAALASCQRWIENGAPGMSLEEFTCPVCEKTFEAEVRIAYGVVDSDVECPYCGDDDAPTGCRWIE